MRYFAFAALVFFTFVPAVAPAQTQDAASLLALHRHYVGWQFGDGTFTSMRESGTLTKHNPRTGTTSSVGPLLTLRVGALYRTTSPDTDTGTPTNRGFTGRLFWASDENGFTRPIYGDDQRYRISSEFVLNEAIATLLGTLGPSQTIDGIKYPAVRVTPQAGFPIDLYIDPSSGALKRYVIDPGGDYETTIDVLAYDEALPGKRVIASFKGDDSDYTATYSDIRPNVPISLSDLHPPPQTATWSFANSRPLPLNITPARILIDATVNGVKGTFILDTGSAGILLDSGFADRAHVQSIHAAAENIGIGGTFSVQARLIRTLDVGGNTLSNVQVQSQNMTDEDYRGLDARGYAGLIGYDLFAGSVVKLDFSNSTIAILDPATTDLSAERGITFNVDLDAEIPAIPMTLDGKFLLNTLLDSGTPNAILFSQDLVYKDHLTMLRRGAIIGGAGGEEFTECGDIASMAIGPLTYEHELGCEAGLLSEHQALIGLDFLKHFNIVFDYPSGHLILEPLLSQ